MKIKNKNYYYVGMRQTMSMFDSLKIKELDNTTQKYLSNFDLKNG